MLFEKREIGYLALALVAIANVSSFYYVTSTYVIACCYGIYKNRHHVNISSLLGVILCAKLSEILLYSGIGLMGTRNTYILLASDFLIDIPVVLLVLSRVLWLRAYDNSKYGTYCPDKYVPTNADLVIIKLYLIYILVNVLAIVEHSLRHLEYFGVPIDHHWTQYLYENARFIYNNIEYIKNMLNIAELVAILSTAERYMRSPRFTEV